MVHKTLLSTKDINAMANDSMILKVVNNDNQKAKQYGHVMSWYNLFHHQSYIISSLYAL